MENEPEDWERLTEAVNGFSSTEGWWGPWGSKITLTKAVNSGVAVAPIETITTNIRALGRFCLKQRRSCFDRAKQATNELTFSKRS